MDTDEQADGESAGRDTLGPLSRLRLTDRTEMRKHGIHYRYTRS